MKKTVALSLLVLFSIILLSGCGAMSVTPVTGWAYTNVKGPLAATPSDTGYSKVGTATCSSLLGIIATGDASIDTAMKNGDITKIHHVDYESTNLLGLIATFTVTVYGE